MVEVEVVAEASIEICITPRIGIYGLVVTEEIFPTDLLVLELHGISPSYLHRAATTAPFCVCLEFEDNLI
jgi:hypothetical protein